MADLVRNLRDTFARSQEIEFDIGKGSLPRCSLLHSSGSALEIYLYGAHVTSWRSADKELLFVSDKTAYETGKAIRGGIPLVFPQFGAGTLPAHGFARISSWAVKHSEKQADGTLSITMGLSSNAETEKIWPFRFEVEHEVRLSKSLVNIFRVRNLGQEALQFQNAFHTYFAVSEISNTYVEGLKGLRYLDSTKGRAEGSEDREWIDFSFETDRIYLRTPDTVRIIDQGAGSGFVIKKSGMLDSVVWNPWTERCKAIADLGDDDFHRFLCVESGNVKEPISIKPGGQWECRQEISCC